MKNISLPSQYLLLGLMVALLIFLCILFAPYVGAFLLAIVAGVLFEPVNHQFRKYMPPMLAALISAFLVVVIVLGLVTLIVVQMVNQANGIVLFLQSTASDSGALSGITALQQKIENLVPSLNIDLVAFIQSAFQWFVSQIGSVFSSAVAIVINLFLALIALVYWFKDSTGLEKSFLRVSPLGDAPTRHIIDSLSKSIHGVVRGTLVVAVLQGVVAGIGFAIFGVPNAILWGSVTAICALVPTIGTGIAIVPIIIYLLLTGNIPQAIGMFAWGVLAVGLIDNVLGPKLMSRGTAIHPFFMLMGVLGGVRLLGPIGLFAGPLVIACFLVLLDTYRSQENLQTSHHG